MTGAPRQARPQGQDPRIHGDPTLRARLSLCLPALVLVVQGLLFAPAAGQAPDAPRDTRVGVATRLAAAADSIAALDSDSLMQEIERYSRMIESMRDSLTADGEIEISPAQRRRFQRSIDELSTLIEQVSEELGQMQFQIEDNTISLLDEAGEGIVIRIPENIDERLSRGLEAITEMVLEEFPDSVRTEARQHRWEWSGTAPRMRPERTRIVEGNVVKIGDDLLVPAEEEVRGNVVVVFGSSEVLGRVDGDVIVVFGDLRLDRAARVTGQVVTIGGRLDRDSGAEAGDVTVIDPFGGPRGMRPSSLLERGWQGFVISQAFFVVVLVVALIATLAAPEDRFRSVLAALGRQPAAAVGTGLLVGFGAHVLVVVLAAVLVLTVIGLPLALLLVLAMAVVGVIATAVAAARVGEWLCHRDTGCPARWNAVLLGMLLLHVPSFCGALLGLFDDLTGLAVAVSIVGVLVKLAAYAAGLGALALTRFGATPRQTATPTKI